MDVLVLATDAYGRGGGIAQYTRDLCKALAASEHSGRVVILPRHGGRAGALPAKVTQLGSSSAAASYVARTMLLAATDRFDVVLAGHLYHAPLAQLLARRWRAKFWLQLHGWEAWDRPSPAIRRAAERAALVTAVSRYTRSRFLEWSRVDPTRAQVLPNTVGERFKPGAARADLLRKLGLQGRRLLLSVARLDARERYKGHDQVIQVLPQLLREQPDLAYLIVGDGDDRQRLEQMAAMAGVSERVCFAGAVSGDELVDYYRLAEIFVMPSRCEGFGIVFLEAAACGLKVIGGNADGSLDALREGAVGWAVDPLDRRQLADAIRTALAAPPPDPARVLSFSSRNFAVQVDLYLRLLIPA